jgi:hypothetical protein
MAKVRARRGHLRVSPEVFFRNFCFLAQALPMASSTCEFIAMRMQIGSQNRALQVGSILRLRPVNAIAAALLLTVFSASPSLAEISEQAMQECAALTNSVRRLTCYDLLVKLRVTEPSDTIGRDEGVVRLHSELMPKLDAWIANQPEPKPSRAEALRRLLEPILQPKTSFR